MGGVPGPVRRNQKRLPEGVPSEPGCVKTRAVGVSSWKGGRQEKARGQEEVHPLPWNEEASVAKPRE